jgi:uncharacterized protein (DUF4415 family)
MNTPPISKVNFLPHDDCLRFVQRVLESDAPKQDREEALAMVRNMRRAVWDEDNTLTKVEAQRDELRDAHEACKAANSILIQDCAATCKAQASEPAPKECHGCRMAQKHIKQLNEENHKLLSAPKREWIGLSKEQVLAYWDSAVFAKYRVGGRGQITFAKLIEAKLKELNHG